MRFFGDFDKKRDLREVVNILWGGGIGGFFNDLCC